MGFVPVPFKGKGRSKQIRKKSLFHTNDTPNEADTKANSPARSIKIMEELKWCVARELKYCPSHF